MSRIKPADKEEYPCLKKPERRHIGVIRERIAYLRQRVDETPGGPAAYHRSEAEALQWALGLVDEQFNGNSDCGSVIS